VNEVKADAVIELAVVVVTAYPSVTESGNATVTVLTPETTAELG
jgi:hypothetical protein